MKRKFHPRTKRAATKSVLCLRDMGARKNCSLNTDKPCRAIFGEGLAVTDELSHIASAMTFRKDACCWIRSDLAEVSHDHQTYHKRQREAGGPLFRP